MGSAGHSARIWFHFAHQAQTEIKKQTRDDLNIIGKPGRDSIYTIFNNTHTRGGAALLEQMFMHPLANAKAINDRSKVIQYFSTIATSFPFNNTLFDSAELYLDMEDERTGL